MGTYPHAFAGSLHAAAHDGRVVSIGRLESTESNIDINALTRRHLTVHGVSFGFSRDWETVPILEGLRPEVLPAVGRGEIRPVIDGVHAAADASGAAARLRSGESVGKIVLVLE